MKRLPRLLYRSQQQKTPSISHFLKKLFFFFVDLFDANNRNKVFAIMAKSKVYNSKKNVKVLASVLLSLMF